MISAIGGGRDSLIGGGGGGGGGRLGGVGLLRLGLQSGKDGNGTFSKERPKNEYK